MKTPWKLAGVLLCVLATNAHAKIFVGGKAGPMLIDLDGFDDPINVGVNGGFIDERTGLGAEGELTLSAVDGEFNTFFGNADVSITTFGAYGTFRSPGNTYFKGRLGVVYEDVEIGSASDDDSSGSGGIGVGFRTGAGISIEIEYTIIEEDVDFLSVGVLF